MFITDQKRFSRLKEDLNNIASLNIKKIHPIYQTKSDFIKNIKNSDKVVLNAVKGIIIFGEEIIIDLFRK